MFDFEKAKLVVEKELKADGKKHYDIRHGNNCVWVAFPRSISCYYILNADNDKIVNVIYD